jgi:enamine deaminase RidA (YjgF/YER057c/UK114 family)
VPIFTAGACPLGPDGERVASGDVAGQAEQVMVVPSTLLGVAMLGYPHQLVEVEAVAALP